MNFSMPSRSVSDNDLLVTGYVVDLMNDTNLLVLRIRYEDGSVVWSNVYGTDAYADVGTGIVSIDDATDSYLVVGRSDTLSPDTNVERGALLAMRIGPFGSIIWSNLYEDVVDHQERFRPKNVVRDTSDQFAIIGDYRPDDTSQVSTFLLKLNRNGVLPALHSRMAYLDFGDLDRNNYGNDLDFTSRGRFITAIRHQHATLGSYVAVAEFLNIQWVMLNYRVYWSNEFLPVNDVYGIHERVDASRYDLFTYHEGSTLNARAFLSVKPDLSAPVLRPFTPLNLGPANAMTQGSRGYFLQGRDSLTTTYDQLQMIATDTAGVDTFYNCQFDYFISPIQVNFSVKRVAMDSTRYRNSQMYQIEPYAVNGNFVSCDTTVRGLFRRPAEPWQAEVDQLKTSVYPTLVGRTDEVNVQLVLPDEKQLELMIYNNLGQIVHQEKWSVSEGENRLQIAAGKLQHGINLMILKDRSGKKLIEKKLIRE